MPTTRPMIRLLNRSRKSPWITLGEYWLDDIWNTSRVTEKAMPAKVMVADATVERTARAEAGVLATLNGRERPPLRCSSATITTAASTMPPRANAVGMTKRLSRALCGEGGEP